MENSSKFQELREKYNTFIYEKYEIIENELDYTFKFKFVIPKLAEFNPTIKIAKKNIKNKKVNTNLLNKLVFHMGLVELISYFKCVCSKEIIIKCGYLNEEQIKWWSKLYYNGLGEFLYLNNIDIPEKELINIKCLGEKIKTLDVDFIGNGILIPIGGGKDSNVSLELLNKNYENNTCFIINPKPVHLECANVAGYNDEKIIVVERTIDENLIKLNNEGFLNGHTPFSAMVAFLTFICAYLNNKRYIVLSNEASANEPTVPGTNINHQYSKTYEFENDFNNYTQKYFNIDIKYFSLLRPLYELQIAKLFAKYKKYHHIFKSCNVGSKTLPWKWCCNCAKCLFIYIILSPFLERNELINIFGEDLFENKELLDIFIELLGYSEKKPFECIGTYEEVRLAVSMTIKKYKGELPFLLKYFSDNYPLVKDESILNSYNEINNLDEYFVKMIKGEIFDNE